MRLSKEEVASELLGGPALDLTYGSEDGPFTALEERELAPLSPVYVSAKVDVDDLAAVSELERAGFAFMEIQHRMHGRLTQRFAATRVPFQYAPVTTEAELEVVGLLARDMFHHGRFAVDPRMPTGVNGERYRRFVLQSFRKADERVYKLTENASQRIVGFGTHRRIDAQTVLLLIGGTPTDLQGSGAGAANELLGYNELYRLGYRKMITHVSAANASIINLEVGTFGFKIVASTVILRKFYRDPVV